MIFHVFYLNFSLHDSLENAFSDHLKWLKTEFSGGFAPVLQLYSGMPAAVQK